MICPDKEMISSDYVRYLDWASNIYKICNTKLISQSKEELEPE